MARKRQRARRQQAPSRLNSHISASDAAHNAVNKNDNVRVRQINVGDEGVLYTHRITVSFNKVHMMCAFFIAMACTYIYKLQI